MKTEVDAWLDWLGRDQFALRDFRPLRPRSVALRLQQVQLYLGALVEAGYDPAEMTSIASVVSLAHAKAGLPISYERCGKEPGHHVAQIAGVVVVLAKHWVELDHGEVKRLQRLASNCCRSGRGWRRAMRNVWRSSIQLARLIR